MIVLLADHVPIALTADTLKLYDILFMSHVTATPVFVFTPSENVVQLTHVLNLYSI